MAPKKAKSEEAEKSFTCTDKELSLLLQVIIDYKLAPKPQLRSGSKKWPVKVFTRCRH